MSSQNCEQAHIASKVETQGLPQVAAQAGVPYQGLLPYNRHTLKNHVLLTTTFGDWVILTHKEYDTLMARREDPALAEKLKKQGLIITENNVLPLVRRYRQVHSHLLSGPSLHIIAVTTRCNLNCAYCHAGSPGAPKHDMTFETAAKVLNMIFKTNSRTVTIEFQGGEALMNWPVVEFIIKEAKKINEHLHKKLKFVIVTNLTIMTEKHLSFIRENGVMVSSSLDGPPEVHDINRAMYAEGKSSHALVHKWIQRIHELNYPYFGTLPTITRRSLSYPHEIVDEYVKHGFKEVHLRHLNKLGKAKENWDKIGYTGEEFVEFWRIAMDHILELNKQGIFIKERAARIMLTKIIKRMDPAYTELMSPCGAGRGQILYDYDGQVYTCDEGRMIEEDLFVMGNVLAQQPDQIYGSPNLVAIQNASCLDNYCLTCAFKPWCGTCPVLNYSEQGTPVPKIKETMRHVIHYGQFEYLFEKMVEDPAALRIFKSWVAIGPAPTAGCSSCPGCPTSANQGSIIENLSS